MLKSSGPRGLDVMRLSVPRARDRIEAEILKLATREESLERRIGALESREDEVYRKWRDEYHELRYRAPTVTRLFQAAFKIAAPNPETSC